MNKESLSNIIFHGMQSIIRFITNAWISLNILHWNDWLSIGNPKNWNRKSFRLLEWEDMEKDFVPTLKIVLGYCKIL